MNHLIMLPFLLPLLSGAVLLLTEHRWVLTRALSLASCAALLPIAVALLMQADGDTLTLYKLGNWSPPFGIVFVLDRLSALLLFATAVLAPAALLHSCHGEDRSGPHFHALFHFQLAGINGAFLTGDLFNLFVCFEILLIASYALLAHGNGRARSGAALHYVVLNLCGSALFLIALGLIYGVAGTLTMADIAVRVAVAEGVDAQLLGAAGLLLLVVFALKAALFPLGLWLTRSYSAAPAAVAALFAIMTKVGVYAILRSSTLIFGAHAGALAQLLQPWLWPLALLTIIVGALGALAARTLSAVIGYMVLISTGTLLAAIALASADAISAALYYLLHTVWASAALFLFAGVIAPLRGELRDRLVAGPQLSQPMLLGALLLIGAAAIVGLPPLSGFVAKLLVLQATPLDSRAAWLWSCILGASALALIAFGRAGSTLIWRATETSMPRQRVAVSSLLPLLWLLLCGIALSTFGSQALHYTDAAATQLLDSGSAIQQVLMSTQPTESVMPPETFTDPEPLEMQP